MFFSCNLAIDDVPKDINVDNMLKSKLGCKKLGWKKKIPNYLNSFHKDVFTMVRQFKPPTLFKT